MNIGTKRLLFYGLQNPGSLFQKRTSSSISSSSISSSNLDISRSSVDSSSKLDSSLTNFDNDDADSKDQTAHSQPEQESPLSWADIEQLNYHHRLLNTDSALAAVRPGYLSHGITTRSSSSSSVHSGHSTLATSGLLIAVCSISALFVLFALLLATYYVYKKRNNSLWSQQQSHYYGTTTTGTGTGGNGLKNKVLLFGRDIVPFQHKQPYSNTGRKSTPTPVRSPSSGQVNPFKKSPSPTSGNAQTFGNLVNNKDTNNNNSTRTRENSVEKTTIPPWETRPESNRFSVANTTTTTAAATDYNNLANHYGNPGNDNGTMDNNNNHGLPKVLGSIENIAAENKADIESTAANNQQQPRTNLGQLHFKLKYSYEKRALCLVVIRCSDLPPTKNHLSSVSSLTGHSPPSSGPSIDPYVKMQLLPEKQHKAKTRVLRKTQNPIYNEEFTFYGITANYLENLVVHFVILNFDRFSRDEILGEVVCKLNQFEFDSLEKQITLVRDIAPRGNKLRILELGELLVSLCYQPIANRLSVVILKGRNLPKMDLTGLCDPYVKIYVFHNKQRIFKKRTHIKKRTLSPVFNESFVFDIPPDEGLENIQLQFLVFDHDRVTRNELIGKIEIGAGSLGNSPIAEKHWYDVIKSPRRQIAEWHKLKESN